jgi:hypothetical protein
MHIGHEGWYVMILLSTQCKPFFYHTIFIALNSHPNNHGSAAFVSTVRYLQFLHFYMELFRTLVKKCCTVFTFYIELIRSKCAILVQVLYFCIKLFETLIAVRCILFYFFYWTSFFSMTLILVPESHHLTLQ